MTIRRSAGALGLLVAAALAGGPVLAADDPHRGGTLRLLAKAAAGTIDPQINYTTQFWQVFEVTHDGLLAFRKIPGPGGAAIVPDLAEAIPAPDEDGRAYTFKLRQGIRFSDGTPLDVGDVAASFRRLFKVASPTSGTFFAGIVGADACLKDPASCTLDGGVVADPAVGTVTFRLVAPDAEFLDKLAVQHAMILPAEAPAADAGTAPLPGTGPYMVAAYDPSRQLRLVRNPHFEVWSAEAQPAGYPEEIDYDFGLSDEAQATEIQNRRADWMFEQPPNDRLGELGTKYASQVHLSPLTAIYHLSMNTRLPPFDRIEARQALNFVLDRKAAVALFGGPALGTPSCQILPPGIPGYEPYCPYTRNPGAAWSAPDPEKAKALVAASGTMGQAVTLIVEDTATGRGLGTYVQSVLGKLGYQASLKALSTDVHFTYIQNTNNKVQISLSYWLQDYPAPSDFLNVLFSCASFREGSDSSINMTGFCDKDVEAMMQGALKTSVTDPAAAAAEWAKVDRRIVDLSPDAVLFVPKHVDFTSRRLGNFTFNPQNFFIFSQAWVQ